MTIISFYHKLFTSPFSFCFFSLILVPVYPQAHVHSCLKTGTEQALFFYFKNLPYTTYSAWDSPTQQNNNILVLLGWALEISYEKKKTSQGLFFLDEKTAKKETAF